MTPEDRAKQAWDAALWGKAEGSAKTLLPYIATAIRAAENDALERAALKCEAAKPWGNMSDDHTANKLQRVADAIRALKHKEAT
jgi:hypothetical protein